MEYPLSNIKTPKNIMTRSALPAISRREFATRCALAGLATTFPSLASANAARNPDKIKIGLVGCGNRGVGALMDAVLSTPNVEICALADLFPEQVESALKKLRVPQKEVVRRDAVQYGNLVVEWNRFESVKVTPETCFTGFDACQKLLQTDVDVVVLATPPGFRPMQIRAVLEAGKHVFAEKPVAIDPVGVRSVLQSEQLARTKRLGFMGGTQLRFHRAYREIMKRVHGGEIGSLICGKCFWWSDYYVAWKAQPRQAAWSDMEHQI